MRTAMIARPFRHRERPLCHRERPFCHRERGEAISTPGGSEDCFASLTRKSTPTGYSQRTSWQATEPAIYRRAC